jgi:hypothetical protein
MALSPSYRGLEHRPIYFESKLLCREGFFILPYNELAIAQGPKIHQKKEL